MAYSGGTRVSINTIYPFLRLRTGGVKVEDYQYIVPEWVLEAERKIGSQEWLNDATPSNFCAPLILPVSNYRALLPKDFYQVDDVQYCIWNNWLGCSCGQAPCTCGGAIASGINAGYANSIWTYDSPLFYSFYNPEIKDWRIEGCYIKVPFPSGNVSLTYYSMPLDEDGLPLIMEQHRDAIVQYCTYQLFEGLNAMGKIPADTVERAKLRWLDLCMQARSLDMLPSRLRMSFAADTNNNPYKMYGNGLEGTGYGGGFGGYGGWGGF